MNSEELKSLLVEPYRKHILNDINIDDINKWVIPKYLIFKFNKKDINILFKFLNGVLFYKDYDRHDLYRFDISSISGGFNVFNSHIFHFRVVINVVLGEDYE